MLSASGRFGRDIFARSRLTPPLRGRRQRLRDSSGSAEETCVRIGPQPHPEGESGVGMPLAWIGGVPPHQGQEAQTVRDLLRQAINQARNDQAEFAQTLGRSPFERLGSEVTRLARLATAAHLMERSNRLIDERPAPMRTGLTPEGSRS